MDPSEELDSIEITLDLWMLAIVTVLRNIHTQEEAQRKKLRETMVNSLRDISRRYDAVYRNNPEYLKNPDVNPSAVLKTKNNLSALVKLVEERLGVVEFSFEAMIKDWNKMKI